MDAELEKELFGPGTSLLVVELLRPDGVAAAHWLIRPVLVFLALALDSLLFVAYSRDSLIRGMVAVTLHVRLPPAERGMRVGAAAGVDETSHGLLHLFSGLYDAAIHVLA